MSILCTLTQSCDLYAPSGREAGLATYSETASSTGVKCRFEPHHKQVPKSDNMYVTSDVLVFLPSTATVTRDYKIVIGSTSYIVDEINPYYGMSSLDHYEAVCREL